MIKFEWQHENEIILFKKHENIISIIIRFINNSLLIIMFSLIISYVTNLFTDNLLISILILLTPIIIVIFFIVKFYKETYLIFTNKRIIKSVRNWLFTSHIKELTIDNIKQVTTTNDWILWKIFTYWNIEIRWYDEIDTVYFKALKRNKDISIYISKVISELKEKWDYEKIKVY